MEIKGKISLRVFLAVKDIVGWVRAHYATTTQVFIHRCSNNTKGKKNQKSNEKQKATGEILRPSIGQFRVFGVVVKRCIKEHFPFSFSFCFFFSFCS